MNSLRLIKALLQGIITFEPTTKDYLYYRIVSGNNNTMKDIEFYDLWNCFEKELKYISRRLDCHSGGCIYFLTLDGLLYLKEISNYLEGK